jgi:hypothetical protein
MSSDFQYGMYYIQIGFRDTSGYFKGQQTVPDTVADDTTSNAYVLFNPVDFTHPQPTFDLATDQGGQKIRAQADMGASDYGEGSFTLSEFDDVFHAYIRSVTVDATTVSGWRQVGSSINTVVAPRLFLIASMQVQVVASDGTTSSKWSHWIYPNVQIRPAYPNGSQSGGVNPNPLAYTFVPSTASRGLDGRLFSATNMALTDDQDTMYRIESANAISACLYTKDGSTTTFTLPYLPSTSDATGAATNSITNNGTTLTVSSVNTSTGVVTLSAAGTASDIVVVVYETAFATP